MEINMIDSDELRSIIEKSKFFKKEMEITINSFDEEFNSIMECYSTNNSNKIGNLANEFKYAFKNLVSNNNRDIEILEKEIQLYIDISNKNKKLFDDIQ
jgi:hypothetical protein